MIGDCDVNTNTEYIADLEQKIKTQGQGNNLICYF